MDSPVIRPILEGLTIATGVPVVKLNDCPAFDGVPLVLDIGKPTPVDTASGRYLLCRYHLLLTSVIVAGPYRLDGEGDLPLLIEAKSAGDFTNTNKRRKEEAVKAAQLRQTYGDRVAFILLLCGYFDTPYLGYEAAEGIDWVWEHRLDDLRELGV